MGKKIKIAVITETIFAHDEAALGAINALMAAGYIINETRERERLKDGQWCTWLLVETADFMWCNVCEERTATHRLRCEKCGARKSAY